MAKLDNKISVNLDDDLVKRLEEYLEEDVERDKSTVIRRSLRQFLPEQ